MNQTTRLSFPMTSLSGSFHDLHQLVSDGKADEIETVLRNINHSPARQRTLRSKNQEKYTPLHLAAKNHQHGICKILHEHKADVNALGPDRATPLHLAAKYKPKRKKRARDIQEDALSTDDSDAGGDAQCHVNNKEVLNFLLQQGAKVNEQDFYGLTPLHHACLQGNESCVDVLLKRAEINKEADDMQKMKPLHFACKYGHPKVAESLLKENVDKHCQDVENTTPLLFAAAEGHIEVVKLLFEECLEEEKIKFLKECNTDGNTALHFAIHKSHRDVINFLIDQCLECDFKQGLDAPRDNGDTPLHGAAKHGELDVVKILVEKGANVNKKNKYSQTPLFFAAQHNNIEVVKYLVNKNAAIDIRDVSNYTPLLIAASNGHFETIEFLMVQNADVKAVDKKEKSIIHICVEENKTKALEVKSMLKDYTKFQKLLKTKKTRRLLEVVDCKNNTPLHIAASRGYDKALQIIFENGGEHLVTSKNDEDRTAMHLAAMAGFANTVKVLANKKKSLINAGDVNGNTPLHLAAKHGRDSCVKILVRLGSQISARNVQQWTPLDCAANEGHYNCALLLLKGRAPVDAQDKNKQTPLHLACLRGHERVVELLLEWGANMTLRSRSGKNALDFAIDAGKSGCALVIIQDKDWEEAMQNKIEKDGNVETPMRKLIKKMPYVALEVFRKCMTPGGKLNQSNYEVKFNYEFLDDEYSCSEWADDDASSNGIIKTNGNADEEKNEKSGDVESGVTFMGGCCKISRHQPVPNSDVERKKKPQDVVAHDVNGYASPDADPYTTNSSLLRRNHPLNLIMESKHLHLLRHPLVISLINHKWHSYGSKVYAFNLVVYALFMILFNVYALTLPPPYAINYTTTLPSSKCANVLVDAQKRWGSDCMERSALHFDLSILIILLSVIGLLKEFFQMVSHRLDYIKSFTNFIEIGAYLFAMLLVIDVSDMGRNSGIREAWQWQCGAFGIFLSWMGLLLFMQNIPKFGIYVLMFTNILQDFVSFFWVFALFILGFAFSFHVLFQNRVAYTFWWNSITKTFSMLLGEFDYEGLFNAGDESYSDIVEYHFISYVLFVLFLIIMSIVIVNLLIGLAVDDIKEIQENAKLEGLLMQVNLTLDIEYTIPQWLRKRFLRSFRKYQPNLTFENNPIKQWYYTEANLSQKDIEEAFFFDYDELEGMENKIDELQVKMKKLQHLVIERTNHIKNVVEAFANYYRVKWESTDDEDDENEDAAKALSP